MRLTILLLEKISPENMCFIFKVDTSNGKLMCKVSNFVPIK